MYTGHFTRSSFDEPTTRHAHGLLFFDLQSNLQASMRKLPGTLLK